MVESEEEMQMWIEKLNKMEELVVFNEEWEVKDKVELDDTNGECSSAIYYQQCDDRPQKSVFRNFKPWTKNNLRGCFDCLPPFSKKAKDFHYKHLLYTKIKGSPPPW